MNTQNKIYKINYSDEIYGGMLKSFFVKKVDSAKKAKEKAKAKANAMAEATRAKANAMAEAARKKARAVGNSVIAVGESARDKARAVGDSVIAVGESAGKKARDVAGAAGKKARDVADAVGEKATAVGEAAGKMKGIAAAKLRFEPVRKIVEYNLGGRTFPGVNCTTIPVLIEHLIRKYLISEQCSINSDFDYDFITGKRGNDGFQDNKFRKQIYSKMMNWLSNEKLLTKSQWDAISSNQEDSNQKEDNDDNKQILGSDLILNSKDKSDNESNISDIEEEEKYINPGNYSKLNKFKRSSLDERLVIGGGLYNLDIGFVNDGIYAPRNVYLFSSDRFFELIRNPTNDISDEKKRKLPTIRMNHYYDLDETDRFTSIEDAILQPKISVMSHIIKKNKLNVRKDWANKRIKKEEEKAEEAEEAEEALSNGKKEVKLNYYTRRSYANQCKDQNGKYDSKQKKCYVSEYPINYQQIPIEQVQLQQVPVQQMQVQQVPIQQLPIQQMPVQQMPLQQIPVQQIPVQQIPMQQVQMIPEQM